MKEFVKENWWSICGFSAIVIMLAFASAVKGFATEAFATTARPSYTLENVCLASVTYHLVVPQWGNSSSVGIARADDRDGKPIPCDGK